MSEGFLFEAFGATCVFFTTGIMLAFIYRNTTFSSNG
jgi:hypothetical protein